MKSQNKKSSAIKLFFKSCALATAVLFTLPFALIGCGKGKGEEKNYNFVLTNATVPVVMSTLDLLGTKDSTDMWYSRKLTFTDETQLGFNFLGKDEPNASGVSSTVLEEMSNKVLHTYLKNKKAKFTLYVTDYNVKLAFKMFITNQIPKENWKINLVEDGNAAYTYFKSIYGGTDGNEVFEDDLQNVRNEIQQAKTNPNYDFTAATYTSGYKLSYAFAYEYRDNVKVMMQYPELLETSSESMKLKLANINFKKSSLTQMYRALSAENQTKFKKAVFDVDYIDPIIKQDNQKKTLVVCGASLTSEQFSGVDADIKNGTKEQDFEKFFNKIMADFPDYNIVIKPHPKWGLDDPSTSVDEKGTAWADGYEGAYERRVRYCNDHNIKVLPGQVPMEVLIWAYGDDIKIGGYNSTLYMNAPKDMTLFFINGTGELSSLSAPLPTIIDSGAIADELKVYYPGQDGEVLVKTHTITAEA